MKCLTPFLLMILGFAPLLCAQNGDAEKTKAKEGFVRVPAGTLFPGCTMEDFKERANDDLSRQLFIFEVWGKYKEPVNLPSFRIGQYTVTNAQWKLYLDRNFRVTVETNGQQTLKSLAEKHIRHADEPIRGQWPSIYALNWKTISEGLRGKLDANGNPLWDPNWSPDRPGDKIREVFLPEGLTLNFYSHVVPKHWIGWSKLSRLSTGKEYVDITAPPKDAFVPPQDEMFQPFRLRAKDFKNFPMRDVAPLEALGMAEWAGCTLPTEYEFERAARGDKPRTRQHPGPSPWNHRRQKDWFAYADNKAVESGPLAVDDPSVAKGDSDYGCRHMLGNIWVLTRTFWDLHPYVTPRPDDSITGGLFNYALMAKGGAWGSGFRQIQTSARTGIVGNAALDLKNLNRADSLGMRLVRHDRPCYDLMTHTIRRMAFNSRLGMWNPVPHAYSMPRMTGADVTHFVESNAAAGYTFVQDKAIGIGFVPLWVAQFDKTEKSRFKRAWDNKKTDKTDFAYLGVLRLDVPIQAGVRLTDKEWAKLQTDRKEYKKLKTEADRAAKKRKGPKIEVPPKPPEPDAYEKATVKQAEKAGVWREKSVAAGEYHVVYWYGFIGLVGRAKRMPPAAILMPKEIKEERRINGGKGSTRLLPGKDAIELSFVVEEWNRSKPKLIVPPKGNQSDLWALSEVLPEGWPGRKVNKKGWRFTVVIPTAKDALKKGDWNTEASK